VAFPNARTAADIALALDRESIEAATALIYSTNDLTQQLEYARKAIALIPICHHPPMVWHHAACHRRYG